jgi:hypothetical protein
MTTALSASAPQPQSSPRRSPRWLASRSNTALLACACIGLAVFGALGRVAGVPAEPGYQISLLLQPNPLVAVLIVAVGLVATTLLLLILQDSHDPFDPIFGAAVGLAALSWRGGAMTDLLQNTTPAVFFVLVIETLLLGGGLYGCYAMLIRHRPTRVDPRLRAEIDWNANLLASAVAAVVMGIVVMLIAQTDAKKQVMAAVGIGGFVGAAAAYALLENESALCYAAAPTAVGVVGYLLAYFFPGIYHVGRTSQPLACPLPLDYAGVGTAASLLGYWAAQRWRAEAE